MVDVQTQKLSANTNRNARGPIRSFTGQAAEVASDAIELMELQAALARADARAALNRSIRPLACLALGLCVFIATLPMVFLGIAGWIAELNELRLWQAQLFVGLVGVLLGGGILFAAVRGLVNVSGTFTRSAEELKKNLQWIRSIFRHTNN